MAVPAAPVYAARKNLRAVRANLNDLKAQLQHISNLAGNDLGTKQDCLTAMMAANQGDWGKVEHLLDVILNGENATPYEDEDWEE